MTTTQAKETLKRYVSASRQYLDNAVVFLGRGEAGKAGELFWGSIAAALQAVAASRGKAVTSHKRLRFFATGLARELEDSSIVQDFLIADSLHKNFYAVEMEPEDVAPAVEPISRLLEKLLGLIPAESLQEEAGADASQG